MENLIQNLYNLDNKIAYSCLKELEVISYTSNEVYKFFETFVEMLDNKNSYIRTRGIVLISSNAKWDIDNKINSIIQQIITDILSQDIFIQCFLLLKHFLENNPANEIDPNPNI